MKVNNMKSINGNKIANQFEIEADNGDLVFQPYNTVIARKSGGKVTLDAEKWDCSTTTNKYRNLFLHETTKETAAKIKSGEYTLADLN
ncbi:MAG: hypothetical protein WC477_07100 [Patescibacteria group bacterium]